MTRKERRQLDDRRNWLARLSHVNNVIKHIEEKGEEFCVDSIAENLGLTSCVVNRIFSEIKNDYSHRFPFLSEVMD